MKHPFSKSLLPLLLILSLLLSCLSPILAATGPVTANTGHRHQLCTELSQQALDYYTGQYSYERLSVLPGKASPTDSWAAAQSNQLYTALQSLMTDTHTVSLIYEGYDYGSLGYFWPKTDAVAGSSTYCYFYSDLLRNEISATMNREHIWPKANASYSQLGGGADLHHLRPSISTVNKAKSDYTFGDIADSAYGRTTSLVEGDVVLEILKSHELVEVRDNIKGDVARILLYVYCRWGQPNLYSDVSGSQLPPPDSDDNTNNGVRAIADLETLLRWCEEDPVDQWEMGRNDQAENVQGNRNVFIDYPEFAWLIFGQTPPDTMSTPSGMAANPSFKVQVSVNNSAYGSAELSNGIIIATPNPGYMVGGYQLLNGKATVTRDGNRFLVTPSTSCHIRIIFVVRPMVYVSLSNGLELSGYMDDSVILPEGPTAPEGYTFVGWSPVPVTSTSDSVQYYDAGSNFVLTEDLELYALYTHLVESPVEDGDFVKVTQEPEDWSGEYLLVYEALGYVFNGSITNPNVNTNCRMLVISGSTIPYADGAP
ncbi:MAG: endonuclease, partial [Oscillospiraceae bacterium]|nr:endonuclease [Oscillospiraceae bacterium]